MLQKPPILFEAERISHSGASFMQSSNEQFFTHIRRFFDNSLKWWKKLFHATDVHIEMLYCTKFEANRFSRFRSSSETKKNVNFCQFFDDLWQEFDVYYISYEMYSRTKFETSRSSRLHSSSKSKKKTSILRHIF